MPLERRNANHYYYRKRRHAGRVTSEYVGAGELAIIHAAFDWLDRADRIAAQAERRAQREAWRREAAADAELDTLARTLARLALLATGHHQHKGTWRKRRMSMTRLQDELSRRTNRTQDGAIAPGALPTPEGNAAALMERCNRADARPEDVTALRALIQAHPELVGEHTAPLRHALTAELTHHGHALKRELTTAYLTDRRAALGYAHAPAIERGLIDHLLLCELRLARAEERVTILDVGTHQADKAEYADRRLSSAQRRYLAAVEALARVRRVRVELTRIAPDGTAEQVAIERPAE